MTRRTLPLILAVPLAGAPKLGTPEWNDRYRAFVKALNLFILDYNEGKLPKKLWENVESTWEELHK